MAASSDGAGIIGHRWQDGNDGNISRSINGADAATLKTRTLTNLYNRRPTWLAHLHAALDRAVWAAYGWDDPDPAAVEEDTILARLLALNLARAG